MLDSDNLILICAFRYALGRMTYVVRVVVDEIHKRWNTLSEGDKELIVKEIREHKARHGKIGHEMDERDWITIVDRYQAENIKRC